MAHWLSFDTDKWVKERTEALVARAMSRAAAEARAIKEAWPPSIYARGGFPAPKSDGDTLTIAKAETKRARKRAAWMAVCP